MTRRAMVAMGPSSPWWSRAVRAPAKVRCELKADFCDATPEVVKVFRNSPWSAPRLHNGNSNRFSIPLLSGERLSDVRVRDPKLPRDRGWLDAGLERRAYCVQLALRQ